MPRPTLKIPDYLYSPQYTKTHNLGSAFVCKRNRVPQSRSQDASKPDANSARLPRPKILSGSPHALAACGPEGTPLARILGFINRHYRRDFSACGIAG